MLYIRLSEFTLLITKNLYLLTYTSPTISLCQSLFYFVKSSFLSFFFFLVPHISESIQYLCLSVCLTSLSICPPGLSVLSQMTVFPFFDWLYNIPQYTYHNFFIHSSVIVHLGCFHSLPLVNKAAKTWRCKYCLEIMISVPSGINLRVGLLEQLQLFWGLPW